MYEVVKKLHGKYGENKMTQFLIRILVLSSIAVTPFSSASIPEFVIPNDNEVMSQYGKAETSQLPQTFNVFVWNLHKGEDQGWATDFDQMARSADILLTQEAVNVPFMVDSFQKNPHSWNMATSFFMSNGFRTGVATGSKLPAADLAWERSKYREPLAETPKMTLFTELVLENGKKLLVVNIHGILANLNTVVSLVSQLKIISEHLKNHDGPAIVAGDFNTWNTGRMNATLRWAKSEKLTHVKFAIDTRSQVLDHVFFRDLTLSAGRVMSEVQSSDHKPLAIQFQN